jgi:acyl dehydratase
MSLDYQKLMHWPFAPVRKSYTRDDSIRFARGYGAGLPGSLQQDDAKYLDAADLQALPMMAVALADGEFWQQNPEAGLQWNKIVHAEEAITMHGPLPAEGEIVVGREVVAIYDRGAERGASFVERQTLSDVEGRAIASIEVTTIARGDGGFGGEPEPDRERVVIPERPADAWLDLPTPAEDDAMYKLSANFAVASKPAAGQPVQSTLRGLCCFGMAGRAVLKLLCDNQPERLRKMGVRYAGVMLTGETVRVEVWRVARGRAVFRMRAVERDAMVLNSCHVEFDER